MEGNRPMTGIVTEEIWRMIIEPTLGSIRYERFGLS